MKTITTSLLALPFVLASLPRPTAAQTSTAAQRPWAHQDVLNTLPNRTVAPTLPLSAIKLDSVFRFLLPDMPAKSLVRVSAGKGEPQPLLPLPGRVVAPLNPVLGYAWAGMNGGTYRLAAWRVPYRAHFRNLNTYNQPMGIKQGGSGVQQLVLVDPKEPRPEGLQRIVALGDTFSIRGNFVVYNTGLSGFVALHPYPGTLPGDTGYGKILIPANVPAFPVRKSPPPKPRK